MSPSCHFIWVYYCLPSVLCTQQCNQRDDLPPWIPSSGEDCHRCSIFSSTFVSWGQVWALKSPKKENTFAVFWSLGTILASTLQLGEARRSHGLLPQCWFVNDHPQSSWIPLCVLQPPSSDDMKRISAQCKNFIALVRILMFVYQNHHAVDVFYVWVVF